MELENNQHNQEIKKHGGRRPNAGRKPMHGAEEVTRKLKRKFNEYVTEEEIKSIIKSMVAEAMEGKEGPAKFILEQHFGKATQRIAGDEDAGPITIQGFNYIVPDDTDNSTST